ncbi:MAG TPA: type II toxin-antitoxin system VapC family toxin [Polyangiaceae bacterium]|nr:type II toxin-antitoxin system VapC family toxin [Polyangiaceae bacterium]
MRYWDASALLPLIVTEPGSKFVDGWMRSDDGVCTWGTTRVELSSAVERPAREGALTRNQRRDALKLISELASAATEVISKPYACARRRFWRGTPCGLPTRLS